MKFDQTPHPEIENHYHIQHLINSQEKRAEDRTYHRNRIKSLEEREDLIKDAKLVCLTDFYCDTCREDFKGQAIKQVEDDWNANQRIAFYKSKCSKGHWAIRLVTDKHRDSFFIKSKLARRDQGEHFIDIIQPFESGYNLVYGK